MDGSEREVDSSESEKSRADIKIDAIADQPGDCVDVVEEFELKAEEKPSHEE